MKKIIIFMTLTILSLLLYSCSDDTTGPSEFEYEYYQGYWEPESPNSYFETIEFNKSNYVIVQYGRYTYGGLEKVGNKLILEDFGIINIINESADEFIIEIETNETSQNSKIELAETFKLSKINEKIANNLTTNLLCYDNWITTVDESGLLEPNSEFVFRRSGHYDFIRSDIGLNRSYWEYNNENSFNFGTEINDISGRAEIVELTRTKLVMRDQLYKYEFKR